MVGLLAVYVLALLNWRHQATIVQFYILAVLDAEELEYLQEHRVAVVTLHLAMFRSVEAVLHQPEDSEER